MKTKLGFPTDDPSRPRAPDGGRNAPTIIGHASHEGAPAGERPAGFTGPAHTGKSNFPARAGFWGRRDNRGKLRAPSEPGLTAEENEALGITSSRRRVVRIAAVTAAATVSALVAAALVKRRRTPPPPPALSTPPLRATPRPVPPPAPPATPASTEIKSRPTPPPKRRPASPRPSKAARPPLGEDDLLAPGGL